MSGRVFSSRCSKYLAWYFIMCPLDRVRREKYKGFEGKVREEVWVDENG